MKKVYAKICGREFEVNYDNPYRNRAHPIGQLEYDIGGETIWGGALLEFGEAELIFDVPRIVGGGNLLNLGDEAGGSAILLAQGLVKRGLSGHVYTVDNYGVDRKTEASRNMERAGVRELITIVNTTTDEAVDRVPMASFVFIDADHSYEGVRSDWINYSKKVLPGGLVAFHDSNQDYTHQVIEELVYSAGWELVHWVNRIKCFFRGEE